MLLKILNVLFCFCDAQEDLKGPMCMYMLRHKIYYMHWILLNTSFSDTPVKYSAFSLFIWACLEYESIVKLSTDPILNRHSVVFTGFISVLFSKDLIPISSSDRESFNLK